MQHVGVRYGTFDALSDIDLSIDVGEVVALVGSSGAGKSTLLAVLAGLVTPTTGSVAVLQSDLSVLRRRQLRRHRCRVGVVPQQLQLASSLKVIHNVNAGRLGTWPTAAALASLVRPAGLGPAREALDRVRLPGALHARTGDLSGGEQQRVAVARVLRQQPDLILADEPVSAVDPALSETVLSCLIGRSAGSAGSQARAGDTSATIVMSLHEPELARRYATRIVGLCDGRVAFDDDAAEVTTGDLTQLYRSSSARG